ncbi:hypothetical protein [Streptosporangium sp. CA-115845]|uniref:hypothetical protein n=1 Tax=Streptosporangium sp. CA-115845 TaxID=3240071 RepID=UPI003D936E85
MVQGVQHAAVGRGRHKLQGAGQGEHDGAVGLEELLDEQFVVVVLVGRYLLDVCQLRGRAAGPLHHLADRPHPRGLRSHRLDQHLDRSRDVGPGGCLLVVSAGLAVDLRAQIADLAAIIRPKRARITGDK